MPPEVVTPELFEDVRSELKSSLSESAFKTWIAPISFVGSEPGASRSWFPRRSFRTGSIALYAARIKQALVARVGGGVEVMITAEAASTPSTPPSRARGEVHPVTLATGDYAPSTRPAGGARVEGGMSLVPHYTFETFIVGPHNQLAVAAGVSIATTGTRAYNPLFIHGRVGLGKTHLLQAICHGILARNPDTRILYVSCEQFVNQFIAAVERGTLETFRTKYRQPDVLVVDDIHFLAGKDRTAEEFFHTFNALHSNNRQIILSSDSPPMEIPSLSERLVSRFKQGMTAELEVPILETRVQLAHRKALAQGVELPPRSPKSSPRPSKTTSANSKAP
jgi:chromosomal replication initiator protein